MNLETKRKIRLLMVVLQFRLTRIELIVKDPANRVLRETDEIKGIIKAIEKEIDDDICI